MYGTPQAAPQPPTRPQARLLRWAFASFPVWSLGLLAWVPHLRLALRRQRPLDWALFALYCSLTFLEVALVELVPEDSPYHGMVGAYLVVYVSAAAIHAYLGDRPSHPAIPAAPGVPAGPATPGVPPAPTFGYGYGYPPAAPHTPQQPLASQQPHTPQQPHAANGPYQPGAPATPPPAAPATPPPGAPATPPPGASPRMRQVASELDQLGEYLRRQEGTE